VPKAFRTLPRGGTWMFKRRRTYNEPRPDQPQARQSSKRPVGLRAEGYRVHEETQDTAAPIHAIPMPFDQLTAPDFTPTACIWRLLAVAGGNGHENLTC